MTKKTHLIRSTGSTIAVALALASAPVLAQEIVLPPATTSSPTQATPPAVPPAPTPPPEMVSSPVMQETPPTIVVPDVPEATPERAAPEPRAAAPTAEPAQPREARVADAPPPAVPDAPLGETTSVDLAPIVPPVADTAPVAGDSAAQGDPADTANQGALGLLAALLAAIAVVALAVWGFVAIGRRRQGRATAPVVERPVIAERTPEPRPGVTPPLATSEASVTPLASPRPTPSASADSLAHTGASVALPSKMPESFEERDALLKRMIAARPDRANPFTSPLQRRRRAKLILQSLGRDFGDTEPWIDLSQYPSNWPSVARRTSAAA